MKQRLLRNQPGSETVTSCDFLCERLQRHSLVQTSFTEPPNSRDWTRLSHPAQCENIAKPHQVCSKREWYEEASWPVKNRKCANNYVHLHTWSSCSISIFYIQKKHWLLSFSFESAFLRAQPFGSLFPNEELKSVGTWCIWYFCYTSALFMMSLTQTALAQKMAAPSVMCSWLSNNLCNFQQTGCKTEWNTAVCLLLFFKIHILYIQFPRPAVLLWFSSSLNIYRVNSQLAPSWSRKGFTPFKKKIPSHLFHLGRVTFLFCVSDTLTIRICENFCSF